MKHLAFVTMELYPLTKGGIGRSMHNVLVAMSPEERQRTVVIITSDGLATSDAKKVFPEVRFESLHDVREVRPSDRYPPKWAYTNTEFHWLSVRVLRKLLALEKEGLEFEYIEFPDWCGLGFATIQEKLFSNSFFSATLAVRLHSTEAVIHSAEPLLITKTNLSLYDIERKALRDCDCVVAQLRPVAEFTRELYGFEHAEWDHRIFVHASPVIVEHARKTNTLAIGWNTPLAFTSKFQQVKAPDVFVRACVGFMRKCPQYTGEVRFLAHRMGQEFESFVLKMIPEDLRERFCFFDSAMPAAQREQLISESIAVFPGRVESFCLAAYEASLLGSPVVLNVNNPAFGPGTPWQDGLNCIGFDSTVEGLVDSLCRMFNEFPRLVPVHPPENCFPWRAPSAMAPRHRDPHKKDPLPALVSVIIPFYNLGSTLPHTLKSVVDSSYPHLEIIVCDDASTDKASRELILQLERTAHDIPLRIVRAEYNRGLAGARNLALRHACGKYVLNLDADDLISADFIESAVQALERNPQYSFVVPQTAYIDETLNKVPSRQSQYADFAIFQGEAIATGLFENRFSTATILGRRAAFDDVRYREEMRALEDWDFYLRAVGRGLRLIVTNEVHFFYRRRRGSMIHGLNDPTRKALRYDDLRRVHALELGRVKVPAYALSAWDTDGRLGQANDPPQRCQRLSSKLKRLVAKVPRFLAQTPRRVGRELARSARRVGRLLHE